MRTSPILFTFLAILFGFNAFAEGETVAEPSLANTALVITDPQNDFLSPDGVTWWLVNYGFIANGVITTEKAVAKVNGE